MAMRWIPLLAALASCSPAAPAEPASRPLRLCIDAAPSAYAQARAEAAAGAWGCVVVAENNCDARVAWSSAPLVAASGAPGLATYYAGAITVGAEACAGGVASPCGRVLLHEVGHALGYGHRAVGIMARSLDDIPPGGLAAHERRHACRLWADGVVEFNKRLTLEAPEGTPRR